MRNGGSRCWKAAALGAMALLLAGCFKVNMDLDVTAENTVSGTAVIAVEESLLELSGQSVDQLFADMDLVRPPRRLASRSPTRRTASSGDRSRSTRCPSSDFTGNERPPARHPGEELNIVRRVMSSSSPAGST